MLSVDVEKRLGEFEIAAKFETAGGVTGLTTSGARSLTLRAISQLPTDVLEIICNVSVCASLLRLNHCIPETLQQRPLPSSRADA